MKKEGKMPPEENHGLMTHIASCSSMGWDPIRTRCMQNNVVVWKIFVGECPLCLPAPCLLLFVTLLSMACRLHTVAAIYDRLATRSVMQRLRTDELCSICPCMACPLQVSRLRILRHCCGICLHIAKVGGGFCSRGTKRCLPAKQHHDT